MLLILIKKIPNNLEFLRTLKDIDTPITVIALLITLFFYYKQYKVKNDRLKLKSVPENERGALLRDLEEKYSFNTAGLTKEQQFKIILQKLNYNYKIRIYSFIFFIFLAALFAMSSAGIELKLNVDKIKSERTKKIEAEIKYRIEQLTEAVNNLDVIQKKCMEEMLLDSVSGRNIQKLFENSIVISGACNLGGIFNKPGIENQNYWVGNSGFGINHLPKGDSYQFSEYKEFDLFQLIEKTSNNGDEDLKNVLNKFKSLSCNYPYEEQYNLWNKELSRTSYAIRNTKTKLFDKFILDMENWIKKNKELMKNISKNY